MCGKGYNQHRSLKLKSIIPHTGIISHSVMGKSPAEMLFGRKLRIKMPCVGRIFYGDIETRDRDSEQKHQMVEGTNQRRSDHVTAVRDSTLVLNKR